jgi:hypothetical protein
LILMYFKENFQCYRQMHYPNGRSCLDWLDWDPCICRYCQNYLFIHWIQKCNRLYKIL